MLYMNEFGETRGVLCCLHGAGEFREQRQRATMDGSAVATALWKRELARRQSREAPGLVTCLPACPPVFAAVPWPRQGVVVEHDGAKRELRLCGASYL